ncbi:MAG: lysophospholipid acyltransferase family protein [Bacteroidales bacterium]|jgi:putative hemolysin|nr:lysophospholipid acyltransferase family protein [Bacteroidales bacterium]MDD6960810.1 lysophospholipid acyltransferase family protein [Bacteroidales bacterium]MDY6186122.1 lysophospholipid acyltransferase family protein [Muribaculaceae bacterium]
MANTETNTDNTDILTDDTEIDTIYGKVPLVVNGRKTAVLDADDVIAMVPKLAGHRRLVERLLHWLSVDKVNAVHAHNCETPGPAFVEGLLRDFDIKLRVDGLDVLDNLPEGPFITVSNHPFGALDGITLIHLVASRRPEYKVMVNMILGRIWAMEPNFIAVDAMSSNDPAKKAVSVNGIRQAIDQVRSGRPLGFFPAGAVSKVNWRGRLVDRRWQPNVIRIIKKLEVPVIPIYFHGSNSWFFNFLGVVCWQLRTLRLPSEVFRKCHTTMHISVGNPITVEEQRAHAGSIDELGRYLKDTTYQLRQRK